MDPMPELFSISYGTKENSGNKLMATFIMLWL